MGPGERQVIRWRKVPKSCCVSLFRIQVADLTTIVYTALIRPHKTRLTDAEKVVQEDADVDNHFMCAVRARNGLTIASYNGNISDADGQQRKVKVEWVLLPTPTLVDDEDGLPASRDSPSKDRDKWTCQRYYQVYKITPLNGSKTGRQWAKYIDHRGQEHEQVQITCRAAQSSAPILRFYPVIRQFSHVFVQTDLQHIWIYIQPEDPRLRVHSAQLAQPYWKTGAIPRETFLPALYHNWRWRAVDNSHILILAHPHELADLPEHGKVGTWQLYHGKEEQLDGRNSRGEALTARCWVVFYCCNPEHYLKELDFRHSEDLSYTCQIKKQQLKP